MCGILGSININNTEDYLSLIEHRGPDASGQQSFQVNGNSIKLLHRRLSIVDLTDAGAQPMFSYNKKACIIFNGEIYNHQDLRKKLGKSVFEGHSDTETIVNYFEEFDLTEKLEDLNGIFAFAYLDLDKELLYLVRDRFAVKPLYYWFKDNQLLFSSEIRPLKALLDLEVEEGSLMECLRQRYVSSPFTIYKDIHKVEPGQLLTFSLKKQMTVSKTYFLPPQEPLGSRKGEYRKLVNEYGELFEKAVNRQLMSDVEIGILLSGGIDSALVAAIAKNKLGRKIKTFTIGFGNEGEGVDEIEYARQTADILGLEHYSKKIDFSDFLRSMRNIVEIVEEPIGTTSIIPMYYLSELAASKVKVVLSGQGADEPLGGYKKYKVLPFLEMSRGLKPFISLTKGFKFLYQKNENLRRLVSSIQSSNNIDSFLALNAISSEKEIWDLVPPKRQKVLRQAMDEHRQIFKRIWESRTPDGANIKNLFPYYDLRTSLSDDLLMYTDKITMHFSLECRVPILDNDLIQFIESLDSRYKFNVKRSKIIHKDFAREYLPSSIIEREKMGFNSPTEIWFKENKKKIEEILLEDPEFKNWFDLKGVKRLLADHGNGQNKEKQIFLLMSLYYILKGIAVDKIVA